MSCTCDAQGCVLQTVLTVTNHISSSSSLSDSSSGSCPPDQTVRVWVVWVKIKDLEYHILKHKFSLNHTISLLGYDSFPFLRKPRKSWYQRPLNLSPPALQSAKSFAAWLAAWLAWFAASVATWLALRYTCRGLQVLNPKTTWDMLNS